MGTVEREMPQAEQIEWAGVESWLYRHLDEWFKERFADAVPGEVKEKLTDETICHINSFLDEYIGSIMLEVICCIEDGIRFDYEKEQYTTGFIEIFNEWKTQIRERIKREP